jgi:hypothetical protein
MAKHCEVCNQSYPDTEPRCPHCAAAEAADSAVDLGEPVVADVASSSGSGTAKAEPPSGDSAVSWSSLVEEVAAPEGSEPFVAEATSGADLPGATVSETPSSAVGEPFVAEAASDSQVSGEPFVAEVASDSKVGGGPFVAEVDEDEASSTIDLGALASRPTETQLAPADAPLPDEVAEAEAGSAVNLGAAVQPTERPSSRDLIAEAVESGVDLAGKRKAAEPAGEAEPAAAEAEGSDVDLGAARGAKSPSSAPEAVPERRTPTGSEHDIDLGAEEAAERADIAAGREDESAVPEAARGPGSSGVDLGGAAGRPRKKSPLDSSSSSAIDMEGTADDAPAVEEEEEAEPASARTAPRQAAAEEEEAAAEAAAEEEEEAPARPARRAAAAAEEEEEEPAAKKPAKARAGCGSLVLVGVVGLLVGAATPIGLLMANVLDPALLGISPKSNAVASGNPGGPKPQQQQGGAPAPADAGQHLKSGDFAKAMEVLNAAPDSDQVQADRGTARWMTYLQEQMGKGAKPNAADEPVQKARTELEAAAAKDNPEAVLALGNLQEYTAGPAEALKTYQDAAKKFKDPKWARVFQAQIDRLDATTARPADVSKPQAAAPHLGDGDVAARALLALLIAFQGAGNEAGGDKGPEEAGYDFWAAMKLAQAGKYPDAIKELEAARAAHDKLRFARLRKAQNPLSDPTEEIFLRSAEEIKAYWTLQSSLAQAGIAGRTPAEIQKSLEALKEQGPSGGQIKAVAEKLKTTPDKAAAAVDALVKERDDAAKKAANLETELTVAKKDADAAKKLAQDNGDKLAQAETQFKGAEAKLKAVGDRLEAAGVKGADPAKGIDTLAAERADANKTLDAVVTKVALAHAKVDRKDVLKGVDQVVEAALVKDPKGELVESREQLKLLDAALGQRHTPEEMMDIWLPVLADRRGLGSEPAKAAADAQRVRNDGGATPVTKQKAAAVLGLARREEGDVEAARTLLTEAVGGAGPKAPWQGPAEKALKQLTDPTAYYLPTARFFYEEGHYKEAEGLLAQGARLFKGKEAASLLALRSTVLLAEARDKGKGKVDAADPLVAAAKKDAQAAADAGDAEGQYALGRISEELGNLADAKAAYAKALAAHAANDEAGARYRLALARVLKLQAEKPAGGRAAARGLPLDDMRRQPLLTLVLLAELGMQPGGGADQDEATRLLKEVESAKDGPDTFLLKAQAQALLGQWTPALKTYAAGLRAHVRRDYADVLADLVEHHPALRRPAALDPPNPLLADAYYAAGLRHYFAGRYTDAEESFTQAIQYDDQDARYFYFLGLSRLALGKATDAQNAFTDGAQLELLNRPGREAVSSALERVQGPARQAVNRARP